jgi:hypothetical protein
MVAYVIFIKERAHNQGELDLYNEMAPAALAGHPDHVPHRARTQGSRFRARGSGRLQFGLCSDDERAARGVQLRVA